MRIHNGGIRIRAVCASVSSQWQSNRKETTAGEDARIRRFIKKTGVSGRYLAGEKQTASDFCVCAARKIMEEKEIDPQDIGVVIFVTQSGDYRDPAGAAVIQHRLGITTDCIAFDMNLGCSGFVCALAAAGAVLQNSDRRFALLLCGETAARERDPDHPVLSGNADRMLFGDAGAAVLLEKDAASEGMTVFVKTDGSRFRSIIVPYGFYRNPVRPAHAAGDVYMDEISVFNFSTTEVPQLMKDYMRFMNKKPQDYDYLVLHQANKFIMDRIVKLTGFSGQQYLVSIDRFGNTSSASIPLTLVNQFGDLEQEKQMRILSCGYGVGLSWAVAGFLVDVSDILPLVHTDEYFEDGFQVNKKM